MGVRGRSSVGVRELEEKGGVMLSQAMVGREGCVDPRRNAVDVTCVKPILEVGELDMEYGDELMDLDLNVTPCFQFKFQVALKPTLAKTMGESSVSLSDALLVSVISSCVGRDSILAKPVLVRTTENGERTTYSGMERLLMMVVMNF